MKKAYLSGPMTGLPKFNFPAFHEAAKELRNMGFEVFNPAESFNSVTNLPWTTYMRADVEAILDCDLVVCLPKWETAVGARVEVITALSIGLPVYEMEDPSVQITDSPRDKVKELMGLKDNLDETILEEAQRLVHGNRGADYGHPYYDFRRTALMVSGLLVDKLKDGEQVTPRDVPLIMNCVKMSREMNRPKRDNRADGAGYWETLDMVDSLEGELNGKDA